jgi:5'-3' exonuclease
MQYDRDSMTTDNTPDTAYVPTLVPLHHSLTNYETQVLGYCSQIHHGHAVAVIDLSWLIYRSQFAFNSLAAMLPTGPRPTGHIYGTLSAIQNISMQGFLVVLAVDTLSFRKELYPSYKEGRVHDGYNPKEDLQTIISLATRIPNVFAAKVTRYEADDILSTFIRHNERTPFSRLCIVTNDHDTLQIKGSYDWCNQTDGALSGVDRRALILKSHGLDLDFLPVWYKVIRGDSGDHIKPGCYRYPSKKLIPLCMDLKDTTDFEVFWKYVEDNKDEKLLPFKDDLWLRYRLVMPADLGVANIPLYTQPNANIKRLAQTLRLNEYELLLSAQGSPL